MSKIDKRKRRIIEIVEEGLPALARFLFDLEKTLEDAVSTIKNDIVEHVSSLREEINAVKVLKEYKPIAGVDYPIPQNGDDGKPGEDYILTSEDKKEIASKIKVPVIEKVIEKTEVVHEQPIIKTEIVKEIVKEPLTDDLADEILKKVDERIKEKLKDVPPRPIFGGRQLRMESFRFSCNGSDTTFTLPKEPGAKGKAIWAYYQGQHIQLGTDYSVSGRVFTCTGFIPVDGTIIDGFIII